jgi:methylmalonyl-CoA mutase
MQALRPLSKGFPPADEAQWRVLAQRGKTEGLEHLASASLDGVPVGPIYPRGTGPVLAMRPPGTPWTVVARIDRGGADVIRADVESALRGGATGFELVFTSGTATHGRGIALDPAVAGIVSELHATVRLDAGVETPSLALECGLSGPTIVAAYDPGTTIAAKGSAAPPIEQSAAGIAALINAMDRDARSGIAFIADGRPWHDAGASEVQELGAVLASAVAITRLLGAHGVEPGRAFRRLGLTLSADADQFLTIAKFRAVRLLFARLAEVIGLDLPPPPVHAETAWRMLSRREPSMNLVRATTAAFAAAAGGADSVTVLSPLFDDEPFNARMARNTQTILIEEASLYRAGDPGAGSGAVEALTGDLASAAWDLFTRIEAEGGLIAAARSGTIQRRVAATREARMAKVVRRQIPLVGVTVHVGCGAVISTVAPEPIPTPEASDVSPLRPARLAEPFENLCVRALAVYGRPPTALLVQIGRGDDPAASADAFAAVGFDLIHADGTGPNAEIGEALAGSGAQVACVVIAADVGDAAAKAAQALRAAGVMVVIAAARSADAVPQGVFDATLTRDTDLVSLFSDVLDRIAEPDKNGQS